MKMLYAGTHRDNTQRPECDCGTGRLASMYTKPLPAIVRVHGAPHSEGCAIVVERKARLRIGTGGAR